MVDTDTAAWHTVQVARPAVVDIGMPGKNRVLGRHMKMVAAVHMTLAGKDLEQGKAIVRTGKGWEKGKACNRALGTALGRAMRLNSA
jgi:hypothetical protein